MSTTGTETSINLRPVEAADAEILGQICYDAFATISQAHNFPPDFPGPAEAVGFISMMTSLPHVYSVAAEDEGKLVGSNFLWEGDTVSGLGPITVDPAAQNSTIGRRLMSAVLEHADKKGTVSVRLVQAAFQGRSLALYTKLGFNTVEPLSNMQGPPIKAVIEGYRVRKMTEADLDAVDALTFQVHGHTRHNEVAAAISYGTASVVEQSERITGYTTGVGFFGHTLGESNEEVKALIAAADGFAGPGFLLPTRNSELMRWCFDQGLKIVQPLTLMSRGVYQEPRGAFMPSILF